MDRFWRYKIDHIIFWLATVGFHMFTRLQLIGNAGFGQFLLEIVVRNGLLAAMIYFNLLVLIPRFAQQKKVGTYVILLIATLGLYVVCKNAHDVSLYGYVDNTYYNLSIGIFYLSFSVALQLSREWYFQRDLIRRIEIEKLNTELEYLKAQINPHFLFNSINTIYFQIDKQNATARETLSAFSEMLRYQLYECNGKDIPVEKEISYLRNYVELQRMRKDENYAISFGCDEDLHGFTIAPLLLIPFVENAFKHVSHLSDKNEIRISLHRRENTFHIDVFNTSDLKPRNGVDHPGIGLRNVRRRLELLYKDRHVLQIQQNTQSFEVNLQLMIV